MPDKKQPICKSDKKLHREDIFSKIIRNEIKCNKVYESETVISFHDINPKANIHILVIPKNFYHSIQDFCTNATANEISKFWKDVGHITTLLNLTNGYRLISNSGPDANQEIPYFHIHILGGENLQ